MCIYAITIWFFMSANKILKYNQYLDVYDGIVLEGKKMEKQIAFITSIAYFRNHKNIELIEIPH